MSHVIVASISAVAVVIVALINRASTKQLRPNGGSSVADAVYRIDTRVERMESRQEHMDGRLARLEDYHYKEHDR